MAKKIYYKSDFDFKLSLTTKDSEGNAKVVPFPDCSFDIDFWTCNSARAYRASHIGGGDFWNCFREEDGSMHFVFNKHNLGAGQLQWEPHFRFPNNIYPDGFQDILRHDYLDIELTECCGEGEDADQQLAVAIGNAQPKEPEKKEKIRHEQIQFVTRGMCRTRSRPGVAYRAGSRGGFFEVFITDIKKLIHDRVRGYKVNLPYKVSISKAFPDGKFSYEAWNGEWMTIEHDIDIKFAPGCDGTYDRKTGEVTVTRIDDNVPKSSTICFVTCDSYSLPEFIGVDETGRVVRVDVRRPARYDVDLSGIPWDLNRKDLEKMIQWKPKPYNTDSLRINQNKYLRLLTKDSQGRFLTIEIERRKKVQRGKIQYPETHSRYYRKWCHVTRKFQKMGVIRARLHTRSGKISGWKYYSYIYTDFRKEITRIDSDNMPNLYQWT